MNGYSSMFLGDTTNIDLAYISCTGEVVGYSYRPKFIVSGKIDAKENVVVDFSTIKKLLKGTIDDRFDGYDHKLWWYEDASKGTIQFASGMVNIKTPYVEITGPADIVKVIPKDFGIEEHVNRLLQEKYPYNEVSARLTLTTDVDLMPEMNVPPQFFSYVHGLKDSTSWGCQNIAHGHLSYIIAEVTGDTTLATELLKKIADRINGTIFAWKRNVNENIITYDSFRGPMKMRVNSEKFEVLQTETTVEHLVHWVYRVYRDDLYDAGVKTLFLSEGLSKGACYTLL